jgi:hypothetical protein
LCTFGAILCPRGEYAFTFKYNVNGITSPVAFPDMMSEIDIFEAFMTLSGYLSGFHFL